MEEKVAYLLGAGFSAPLGLPVVSNFISRSKDLYFGDRFRYAHFDSVFKLLHNMARAKNYYRTDLSSIEEVLSILEMEDLSKINEVRADQFGRYICDTIEAYTPPLELPPNAVAALERASSGASAYISFVASLFCQEIVHRMYITPSPGRLQPHRDKHERRRVDADFSGALYSVVTLNYDLVLEKALSTLGSIQGENSLRFNGVGDPFATGEVGLAKLHGSSGDRGIILPTWNKVVSSAIREEWRRAFRALSEATQIRIIGYSFPVADAYVRYLLKAAALESEHLKHIDILCLDPEGEVRARYAEVIDFKDARFANGRVEEYISFHRNSVRTGSQTQPTRIVENGEPLEYIELVTRFTDLEVRHHNYFSTKSSSLSNFDPRPQGFNERENQE